VLYLAHCTREKGLFDALHGVARANQTLAACKSPVSIRLIVAGNFVDDDEKAEFDRFLASPENRDQVQYLGFVSNETKHAALRDADFFCFPTYYQNENQPVSLIEAMAYGLPILTTRWRSIPELFPAGYRGVVDIRSPEQIAAALLAGLTGESAERFREIFLRHFNLDQHLAALAEAFHSIKRTPAPTQPAPSSVRAVPVSLPAR
jgi:glycosyltransferase involved in cell wall biosynthesis